MDRRYFTVLGAVAAFVLLTAFGRGAPIYNVNGAPIPPGPAVTLENIEKGVMRAGLQLGWQIVPKAPGHVEGILVLRTHRAIVDITFDTKTFNIVYRDSVNLDYEAQGKTIHSNYNGWIQNLEKAIRVQLTVL